MNTSLPTISGTARAGETLTAASGAWSELEPDLVRVPVAAVQQERERLQQHLRRDQPDLQLQKGDAGRRMRVSVTAKNSDGSANARSAPTGVIAHGLKPENTVAADDLSGTAEGGQHAHRDGRRRGRTTRRRSTTSGAAATPAATTATASARASNTYVLSGTRRRRDDPHSR